MSVELRFAVLEWACRQAAGQLDGLHWVDGTVHNQGELPFQIVRRGDQVLFRHRDYGQWLPAPMVRAAKQAQTHGVPTALEGVIALFARAEWLIAAREHYWAAYGPVPALLAALVEAYGIPPELHRGDREHLARLVAHLPTWYPHRGDPVRGKQLMERAFDKPLRVQVNQRDTGALRETFTCRSAKWHARRVHRPQALHIHRGMVQVRHTAPTVTPEDVVMTWSPGIPFPHELLRLLPAWVSVRLHRTQRP